MSFRRTPSGRRRKPQTNRPHASASTFEPLEHRTLLAANLLQTKVDEATTRVSTTLLSLYDSVVGNGQAAAQAAKSEHLRVDAKERVSVTITADDVAAVTKRLATIGFVATASYPSLHFVEGLLPVRALRVVGAVASKLGRFAVLPSYAPMTMTGSVNSEADFVMEADRVRNSLPVGFNGNGVKIGVLSDSFDTGAGSYAADQASGDLPAGIQVIQDYAGGGQIDEGRAMLQLIHDIAPGSPLAFATAFVGGEGGFASNITALANAGAKVIVDDVVYFAEPMFQDGVIAQAIDNVVTNQGVAYFSSAGNSGNRAYESSTIQINSATIAGVTDDFYDFNTGGSVDNLQRVTVPAGSRVVLSFQWDDPFYTANGVNTDLDLVVLNTNGTLKAISQADNVFTQTPYEQVVITNSTGSAQQFDVAIRVFAGPNPGRIKLVDYGGRLSFNEFATDSSTVSPHAAALNARGVAAVPYFDQTTPESFTSHGPSTILFSPNGAPIAPETRQAPRLTGVDGTNTTFFGGNDFEADGRPNFFGTSAAAPHVAAVAALVKHANPGFTPAQIYSRLETTADDIVNAPAGAGVGFDNVTGFGLVNAFDAVFPNITPATLNFSDGLESGTISGAYETRSTGPGRIVITTTNSPATGTRHLALDASLNNGVNALNELTLHLDLSGPGTKTLSFRNKEGAFADDHSMPATFANTVNADGVALSVNGVNWFRIVDLIGANSTTSYSLKSFDLSAFAAANGIALTGDTRIRFQSFDAGDGFFFDDIAVTSSATGAISGKTFHDFDNDGLYEPLSGETVLSGVTVNLDLGNNGSIDATAVSNGSGDYSFSGLVNGAYNVTQSPTGGFAVQTANHLVNIAAGESVTGRDFANTPTGALTFTGTGGADNYLLRRSADTLKYEILIGGVLTHVIPQAGVTSLTFDLAGGGDALTIDYANTAPIPAAGFVKYDGGGTSATDTDLLTVNGSGAADAITIINANAGAPPAGSIVVDDLTSGADTVENVTVNGNAGADTLTAGTGTGIAFTYDGGTESDALIYNTTPGDDTINVGQNSITGSSTPINFGILEVLTVNAGAGFDTVNVNTGFGAATATINLGDGNDTANLTNVHNTTPITVSGGNGDDLVFTDTLAGNAPLSYVGGANNDTFQFSGSGGTETINVTATTVQKVGFANALGYSQVENLIVNALSSTDTINASVSAAGPTTVTLDGGVESDTFNVTPSSTALFRVIGGAHGSSPFDTLNITQAGAVQSGHGASSEATFQEISYSNRQSVRYKEIETLGTGIEFPPTITSLTDSPDPVVAGANLTLTANGVADANGGTLNVVFYRESNGSPGLQLGGDAQVGSDNSSPYSITIAAPAPGSYTYYAQVTDATSLTSNVVSTTNVVSHATIAARRIFYNASAFDGIDASANAADDAAIATDKLPLLPGGSASFANYTSYSRGINGVMIDLAGLPVGATLTAADFAFKTGNNSSPAGWTGTPPAPTAIATRDVGGGVTRVTLTWADNAIQKQWLQVTVLATANTGLATSDVFYFGNAVAESGNNSAGSPPDARVDTADELGPRANPSGFSQVPVTNVYDYDRDRRVNTADQLIARNNRSGFTPLQLISVPVADMAGALTAGMGAALAFSNDDSLFEADEQDDEAPLLA